jgi:hypothetical protein
MLARQAIGSRTAVRSRSPIGSIASVRASHATGVDDATCCELSPACFDREVDRGDDLGVRLHAEKNILRRYQRGLINGQNRPRRHNQINHCRPPPPSCCGRVSLTECVACCLKIPDKWLTEVVNGQIRAPLASVVSSAFSASVMPQ